MDKTDQKKTDGWTHHHTFLFGLVLVVILIFVLDRKYSTKVPSHSAVTEKTSEPEVVLDVLSDKNAAIPGKELILGFLLKIKPGWHIYGPQPGDAGAPTEVSFSKDNSLPAPKVLYPPAKTFQESGDITVFGYENEVMLLATYQIPKNSEQKNMVIAGAVSWLACKDVCIPGEQHFRIELPVRDVAQPTHSEMFSIWKQRIAEIPNVPSKP